jgi:hypothetical protein
MTKKGLKAARAAFIDAYAATFMASYTVNRYGELCCLGKADQLAEPDGHGIAEDAVFIAGVAWKKYREFRYPKAFRGKKP